MTGAPGTPAKSFRLRRPGIAKLVINEIHQSIKDQVANANKLVEVDCLSAGEDIEREFRMLEHICDTQTSKPTMRPDRFNPLKDYCQSVLPYPPSRANTLSGTYINASIVDSIFGLKFIAAQGPLASTETAPGTVEDFWSMVAHHRVTQIVSLCGDGECADYLPRTDLSLNLLDGTLKVKHLGDEAVSVVDNLWRHKLEITHGEDSWQIEQLHCKGWQDHGVLEPSSLMSLAERMNAAGKDGTTVVHCRAGAGRTGCLLAVCSLLADLELQLQKLPCSAPLVSVPGTVAKLRSLRPHMVQTLEQYESIYASISLWNDIKRNRVVAP